MLAIIDLHLHFIWFITSYAWLVKLVLNKFMQSPVLRTVTSPRPFVVHLGWNESGYQIQLNLHVHHPALSQDGQLTHVAHVLFGQRVIESNPLVPTEMNLKSTKSETAMLPPLPPGGTDSYQRGK